LLNIIDFNNTRKRMSVILKRNNKIILYCKGADNVIYERLGSNQNDIKLRTQEHLNVRLNQFEEFEFLSRNFHRNSLVKASEHWF
jgi:magnesium-transporting ATPase (P-type)